MLITVHDIIEKCKFYTENENVDFAAKEDEDGIMIKFLTIIIMWQRLTSQKIICMKIICMII